MAQARGSRMARPPAQRLAYLTTLAAVVGLAGGVAGWLFLRSIALLLNLSLDQRVGWELPQLADVHPRPVLLLGVAVVAALLISVFARWDPLIRGHGVPEAMEAVLARQSRVSIRTAILKPLATALAVGSGAPFGAEGPIIITGGAIGSLIGQAVRVSPAERKILLGSGAAAGMAAIFGTPFAAVLLALELLMFEFSTRSLAPLVVAAVLADGVHTRLIRQGPLFAVPEHQFAGLADLPYYLVLGVAAGLLATLITTVVYAVEDGFELLPIPRFWHPAVGAVGFVAIGLVVPRALGVGYDVIGEIFTGRLGAGLLATILVAKLLAWWIAMGSGTSGSALAPILLIGSAAGALVGTGLDHLFPGAGLAPGAFAIVGMAATFGSAAGAPFASMMLAFEMTRDFDIVLPLMLATIVAHLAVRALLPENLMTEKLARRGIHVSTVLQVDVLSTTPVAEVMDTDAEVIHGTELLRDAIDRLRESGQNLYPVIDADDRCIGVLTQSDVATRHHADPLTVADICSTDVVEIAPQDTALTALQRMVSGEIRALPVLDAGHHVLGVVRELDVLRLREDVFTAERAQLGWLQRRLRRVPTATDVADQPEDP